MVDVGSVVLLSSEVALRRRLDVTANNLANSETAGFKREQTVFRTIVDRMDDVGTDAGRVMRPIDVGRVHDQRGGAALVTGDPLHAMIEGDGWFGLRTAGGDMAFSRDGRFRLDSDGQLIGAGGLPVLDAGGAAIRIAPEQVRDLKIAGEGMLASGDAEIGRIGVFRPVDEAELVQLGDGLWSGPSAPAAAAASVRLRTGVVEGSNVQAIVETSELIDILRDYQASQTLGGAVDDLRRRAIERLGRAGR